MVAPLGTITMYGTLTLALPVLLPDACARGMCLAPREIESAITELLVNLPESQSQSVYRFMHLAMWAYPYAYRYSSS